MAESSSLKVYGDYLSQPSRAVLCLCLLNNIPFKFVETRPMAGQHLTQDFKKINPLRKVPAIEEDGFTLGESTAILKYLCNSKNIPEHWYPNDPKKRALVDQYLDWHHSNTRKCNLYFIGVNAQFYPKDFITWDPAQIKKEAYQAVKVINDVFLKDRKFIASDDEMTIADLCALCELAQLHMTRFDFSKFPKVQEWMKRMFENKVIQKVHVPLFKFKEKLVQHPRL